jgi:hypothetical protein
MWLSEPRYRGPLLVRGHRFAPVRDEPGGRGGKARVGFGTRVRPEWELRLPSGPWGDGDRPLRAWGQSVTLPGDRWRLRMAYARIRYEGCYFLQFDGKGFSQTVVFGAMMQP